MVGLEVEKTGSVGSFVDFVDSYSYLVTAEAAVELPLPPPDVVSAFPVHTFVDWLFDWDL
jgi:hypothetical protein